jgi:hypothetical protein
VSKAKKIGCRKREDRIFESQELDPWSKCLLRASKYRTS